MLLGFDFQLFVGVFFIPLLYALVIYLTAPYKSVSFKRGLVYLFAGMMSVVAVQLFYFFVPWFTSNFSFGDPFVKFFFVVGPVEELSKFLLFFFILNLTNDKRVSDHPFRHMFYLGMTGLGFAIMENIHYASNYGEGILFIRTFTSTIAHMIFGLLCGYWVGLGVINKKKMSNRSVFGVLTMKYPFIKRALYTFTGLLVACFYHGLYNYNLITSMYASQVILIMILMFGLIFSRMLAIDLNNQFRNREIKKDNPKELS
tara:strand:- start:736 stop:1509 length:774 start_codon:yes stop_codon:yes gene_type:complete